MLTRRELVRNLSLAAMAVTAAPLLAGCGDDTPSARRTASPSPAGDGPGLELVSSDVRRTSADAAAIPGAVAGVHALGAGLYGQLVAASGNLAISPFSIAVALGLTVNGARGGTASEMLDVLGASDLDGLDTGLNALTTYVEGLAGPTRNAFDKPAEVALDSANGLFGQAGEAWEQPFLDRLARDFGAGLQTVDWKGATEAARAAVNAWTAKRTHDRIEEILPEDSVGPDTRLVLVNALYFKAPWQAPFEKGTTQDQPFHLTDGTSPAVPMMATEAVPLLTGDGYRGTRLDYAGTELAMTLLLPDGDLAPLEARLADGGLPDILASTPRGVADLTVPRWTFRTQVPLREPLSALGMPTAFTAAADFGGITIQEPLELSEVFHQVFVAVDEEGTEAAAATAVVAVASSAQLPNRRLVLDRPFLFVLHDVAHGTPLFLGRVADPRS